MGRAVTPLCETASSHATAVARAEAGVRPSSTAVARRVSPRISRPLVTPSGTSASIHARSDPATCASASGSARSSSVTAPRLTIERVLLGLAVLRAVGDRQLHGAAQRSRQREEPRREPEDGTDVDRLVATRLGPRPLVAPARERAEDRDEVAGPFRQLVVDARRHLAVALAGQQAVGDHAVQARTQLLRRDARQRALELDEPARTADEVAHDQQRPLVADEIQGARVRRPLVVWMAFGRGSGWDGDLRFTCALDLPTVIQINRLTGSRGIPLTRPAAVQRIGTAVQRIARRTRRHVSALSSAARAIEAGTSVGGPREEEADG